MSRLPRTVRDARRGKRAPETGRKGLAMSKVLILGVAFDAARVSAAKEEMASFLPMDGNSWTWEIAVSRAFDKLGASFPTSDTKNATVGLASATLRGILPNTKRDLWRTIRETPKDEPRLEVIIGAMVSAIVIHGARATGKSLAVPIAEPETAPAQRK